MTGNDSSYRQSPVDIAAAVVVAVFAVSIALFSVRNNDVWWLMAVGRYIAETKAFIYSDPFSFTLSGAPWSPQGYLAGLIFYGVHAAAGPAGLIAVRAVLVALTVAATLWTLRRAGVSWAASSPFLVLLLLTAHTRFTIRAHLFEYLFIAVLLAFLVSSHRRTGRSFFVVPTLVQLVWVNTHPSFLLGPGLVVLFFAGEWVGSRFRNGPVRALHSRDYKRVGALVALILLACLANPNPAAFLAQPLGGEQRELMSRFTLEWKSPFDPALSVGNFHPYFEMLIAVAAVAVLLSLKRLPLALVLPMLATLFLALQSHRFRVEFALIAAPVTVMLLRDAALPARAREKLGGVGKWVPLAALALSLVLMGINRDRIETGRALEPRYPDRSLDFVANNNIGYRMFTPIGFGSYEIWHLYGERLTFIDGRNFDAGLYRDYLACQSNDAGFGAVVQKYQLDAFMLPPPEASDAGETNIHESLTRRPQWGLVHIDELAMVYVDTRTVDADWLERHEYREYHPMSFRNRQLNAAMLDAAIVELERAVKEAPHYTTVAIDLGLALTTRGRDDEAVAVLQRARKDAPDNPALFNLLGQAATAAGNLDAAVAAYRRLVDLAPDNATALRSLGRALSQDGKPEEAIAVFERLIAGDPKDETRYGDLFAQYAFRKRWDAALSVADRMERELPENFYAHFFRGQALAGLGRDRDALAEVGQALQINHQVPGAHLLSAQLHARLGDIDGALQRIESTLQLDPDNAAALKMKTDLLENRRR